MFNVVRGFKFLNFFWLLLAMVLLYLILPRYGFSRELAALAVLLFFSANAPILDTLIFNQINLLVLNCILLSLLLFPRYPAFSGLFLGIGAHLKIFPVIIAALFLVTRKWKWLAWFFVWQAAIVAFTSWLNSASYYPAAMRMAASIQEFGLRNASVDSFIHNSLRLAGWEGWTFESTFVLLARLGLAVLLAAWILPGCVNLFGGGEPGKERLIRHGYLVLPLAALAISPTIWVHHFVLISLPALALMARIRSEREMMMFSIAYALIFWLPVNEVYPISYLRFFALLALVWLSWRDSKRNPTEEPTWLTQVKAKLAITSPGPAIDCR
jgi:hypothetical protein